MGGGGPSTPSTTTQVQDIPEWQRNYLERLYGKAEAISEKPYQAFSGPKVAGFTDAQNQAFSKVQDLGNTYKPAMQAGVQSVNQGLNTAGNIYANASPFAYAASNASSPNGISAFMSPYTNSVVDGIVNKANTNWNDKIMPSVNDAFIGSGQFASGRNAQVLGQAANNFQTNLNADVSNALQAGYNTAGNQANQYAQTLLNSGSQLGNLAATQGKTQIEGGATLSNIGSQQFDTGFKDAQALQAVGQQQQQQQQLNLNTAQNDFNEQRDYPKQQTEYFNNVIRGLPSAGQSSTTQVSTGQFTSPLNTLGSTAASVAGILADKKLARGGLVRGYAEGGLVDDYGAEDQDYIDYMNFGDVPVNNDFAQRLLAAQTQAESGGRDYDKNGNPLTSSAGAMYKRQVMPATAYKPGFGIIPATNDSPEEFNRVGDEYHAKMMEKYNNPALALAAYNAGPGAVDNALKKSGGVPDLALTMLPQETQDYVPKILANAGYLQQNDKPAQNPFTRQTVQVETSKSPLAFTQSVQSAQSPLDLPEYEDNSKAGRYYALAAALAKPVNSSLETVGNVASGLANFDIQNNKDNRENRRNDLKDRMLLARLNGGAGNLPAAIQMANEVARLEAAGDIGGANRIREFAKTMDKGVQRDVGGNIVPISGAVDTVKTFAGAKAGASQQAKADVDYDMKPKTEKLVSDAKNLSDIENKPILEAKKLKAEEDMKAQLIDDKTMPEFDELYKINKDTFEGTYAPAKALATRFIPTSLTPDDWNEKAIATDLLKQKRITLAAPLAKLLGVNPTDRDLSNTLDSIFDINTSQASREAQINELKSQAIRKKKAREVSKSDAPAPSGNNNTKTIVKTEKSPSTGKTRITYSDGTQVIQ